MDRCLACRGVENRFNYQQQCPDEKCGEYKGSGDKSYQLAQHEKDTKKILDIQSEIRKREHDFAAVSIDYMNMKPTYFNSGCCCYTDGDITGIEIDEGCIRLVKWKTQDDSPAREVLEEMPLEKLLDHL